MGLFGGVVTDLGHAAASGFTTLHNLGETIAANDPANNTGAAGGGGGGYSAPAYADPYAKYGGQAAYQSQVNNFNAQKQGIMGSADNAIGSSAQKYNQNILNFLDTLRAGQRGVDQAGLNNEMKYQQGSDDVRDMVGTGLTNAGTMLATRNATNSGSGQKFADAYGRIGRQQMSKVGNQYELGNRDVNAQQQGIDEQKAAGLRNMSFDKDSMVNGIVDEAHRSLSALDAAIAGADLPTRIAIEQEKQGIRQRALDQLGQFDATLNQGAQGVHGMDANSRRAQAHDLRLAGQAPQDQFDYTTDVDMASGVGADGAFPSQLPIFTFNRRRTA